MESLKRLVGVLFAPTETFRKIAERPTWAVALVVLVLLAIVTGTVVNEKIDPDAMRDMIRTSIQEGQGLRGDALEEQTDAVAGFLERFGWINAIVGSVIYTLVLLLMATLILVGTNLIGGEIDYRRSVATMLHGMVPQVVGQLIAIPIILAGGALDPVAAQRQEFLRSNLAFLAPENASSIVAGALWSVDVFVIWSAVLLVIGLSVVGRLSKGAAIGLTFVWWILIALFRSALWALSG